MDTSGAVLVGAQRPALWTAPNRHRTRDSSCSSCADREYTGGCGNHVAEEVLDWAKDFWTLDDWQQWVLTEGLGVKPNRRWVAKENGIILPRQNGKGTILEVRELAGIFLLGEFSVVHTAHLFATAKKHFARCCAIVENNSGLIKRVRTLSKTHGQEAIILKAKPTLIFGPNGTQMRRSAERTLEFIARSGKQGRGFTCNCLVYDEAMYLTSEHTGASRPTLAAVANHQIWVASSAGMKDSTELAIMHERILDSDDSMFGAEWGGITLHSAKCPRDRSRGRKTNDYVVDCAVHDDRDDPKVWARANPAYNIRIEPEFFPGEIKGMADSEFNREFLNVGEWPLREAAWKVIDKELWESLTVLNAGTVAPVTIAVDVDEDSKSSAIGVCWQGEGKRLMVSNPKDCVFDGTDELIPRLNALYDLIRKQFGPVIAIAVPREGPAAGVGDTIEKKYRDKVVRVSSQDSAAAFAFFTQQCNEDMIGHAPRERADYLYAAVGGSETREVGDGGKTWKRREALTPVSPATSATLAAWVFNKKRSNYDILKSIG